MSHKVIRSIFYHVKHLKLIRKYSKLSYLHNIGQEPLRPLTFGQLLEQVSIDYSQRPAIVSKHQNKQITFKEALYEADRLAAGFYKLGLSKGDPVGILAPNMIEWYITALACARGGFLLIPINPLYEAKEIEYCINKVKIKTLVMGETYKYQNYYELLNKICRELPSCDPNNIKSANLPTLKNIVVVSENNMKGCYRYNDIMNMPNDDSIQYVRNNQYKVNIDDPCNVQFTSGTTGKSKVATISHFSFVNNGYYVGKRNELHTKHHKICLQNPLFHAYGTVIGISAALNYAATLVLPAAGFEPEKSLDAIKEEKCTVIYGTPTMYVDLIKVQSKRQEEISPEIALSGGASCSPQLFQDMLNILKVKKVKSVYGLSETTAVVFQSLPEDGERESTDTVGYIQEHLEAKVVDANDNIVPRGSPGELCIRGYVTMLGYTDDVQKTQEIIKNSKWLYTGDQFVIDERGYGKVVGRIKELIIRGGENIYPKEIEDFLQTHPAILETQVIGLRHERLGEEVCACVRLNGDSNLTLDDLRQFCKGKIARYKIPTVLKIMESFPTTTSGKIQKFKLVGEILAESTKSDKC